MPRHSADPPILLVEDKDSLRTMLRHALEAQGHSVMEARDEKEAVQALRTGAIVARADVSVLELMGPGAVTCLQGLLTNDLEKPGDGAFVYGALLTPKGMIVVDGWAARLGTTVRYTVPAAGRDRAHAIFERSIPPRLARTADRSSDLAVVRLAGVHALALAEAARMAVPAAPGKTLETTLDGGIGPVEIARASDAAPFALQVVVP